MPTADLTFALLDDWGFSAEAAQPLVRGTRPLIGNIGPLVELAQLARRYPALQEPLAALLDRNPLAPLVTVEERNHLVELGPGLGILHLDVDPLPDVERTNFSIRAKAAATAAGFAARTAGQLTAAMLEMLDNIVEHSGAAATGRILYQASPGQLTFVACDAGIGALASLNSNPLYQNLATDRDALPLVLRNGCSRFADPGRGRGFDDLFRGLADHNGSLRFRSGSAAVLIDGRSPEPLHPKVKPKPALDGFFACVSCAP